MKKIPKRLALISVVISMLVLSLAGCGNKELPEEKRRTPYEKSIPASFSVGAGFGREKDEPEQKEPTGHVILVDAGHGFMDGGCGEGFYSDGTLEKDITLAVAKLLNERLQLLGYETIMTHDGENLPAADTNNNKIFSASERVVYANELDIDYLISIHVNAFAEDSSVHGMNIYYQQSSVKVNSWGADAAKSIADSLDDAGVSTKDTNIKDGKSAGTSFALTRDVKAASSLLEIGFVTNKTDADNMVDPAWQKNVANAVADGIDKFFKELDGE